MVNVKKIKQFFLISLMLVVGCDVPGKLTIHNRTGEDAMFRYTIIRCDGHLDTIEIGFENNQALYGNSLNFGFGWTWSDEQISEYVEEIQRIEMITVKDTIVISDKQEMFEFFRKRRKGLWKKEVRVVIK